MASEDVRVAVLETKLDELRGDVTELVAESQRTRKRLHDLEGVAGTLVDVNRNREREDQRRERKYTQRLNLLTALAALAAVISPLVVALLHVNG